eukprot:s840_g10.t1
MLGVPVDSRRDILRQRLELMHYLGSLRHPDRDRESPRRHERAGELGRQKLLAALQGVEAAEAEARRVQPGPLERAVRDRKSVRLASDFWRTRGSGLERQKTGGALARLGALQRNATDRALSSEFRQDSSEARLTEPPSEDADDLFEEGVIEVGRDTLRFQLGLPHERTHEANAVGDDDTFEANLQSPLCCTFQSLTFDRHSRCGATGEFFRVQLDDFSAESADLLSFHHVDIAKCQEVAGNRKTDPVVCFALWGAEKSRSRQDQAYIRHIRYRVYTLNRPCFAIRVSKTCLTFSHLFSPFLTFSHVSHVSMGSRRPTLVQNTQDLDMEDSAEPRVQAESSEKSSDKADRKSMNPRKHVTISDEQSTLTYDPEKPSTQAPPKPAVTYQPSRRSEVWDNRYGGHDDSDDEQDRRGRGMQNFEIHQPRNGQAGDRCDRCTDRCTDQCAVM